VNVKISIELRSKIKVGNERLQVGGYQLYKIMQIIITIIPLPTKPWKANSSKILYKPFCLFFMTLPTYSSWHSTTPIPLFQAHIYTSHTLCDWRLPTPSNIYGVATMVTYLTSPLYCLPSQSLVQCRCVQACLLQLGALTNTRWRWSRRYYHWPHVSKNRPTSPLHRGL